MPTKAAAKRTVVPDPTKIRAFPSAPALETWLAKHHASETELWLKIHKKASGLATVTYAEAVDVALCWGWIDGLKKSFDESSFLQRFTPRKGKSIWSQINRDHVARLVREGRMTPHGQVHVDAAIADGRWDAAYASGRTMTIPDDFRAAVEREPVARALFAKLDKANLFALGFRVHGAKTPEGRAKTITRLVAMLARGETLHPLGARAKAAGVASAAEPAKRTKRTTR